MRLSDVKGERTYDVIGDSIDPILNIAEDEDAAELFVRKALPDGMTPKQFLVKRARKAIPALMRNHKRDLTTILASIKGISESDFLERLNPVSLAKDVFELLTDEAFLSFFTSDGNEAADNSSGSVLESSGEEA